MMRIYFLVEYILRVIRFFRVVGKMDVRMDVDIFVILILLNVLKICYSFYEKVCYF